MEDFLCYIYSQRLFEDIKTDDGKIIEVVHPGIRNLEGKPDFFNAKFKIGEELFTGNVNVNIRATEIEEKEDAILNVVLDNDMLFLNGSRTIAVMKPKKDVYDMYFDLRNFLKVGEELPCKKWMFAIPDIVKNDWFTANFIHYCTSSREKIRNDVKKKKELLKCKTLEDIRNLYKSMYRKDINALKYIYKIAVPAMVDHGASNYKYEFCETASNIADTFCEEIEAEEKGRSMKVGYSIFNGIRYVASREIEENYCSQNRCTRCRIGCYIMKHASRIKNIINNKL